MKIAVVAANGKAGRLIVEEALNRGLDVTAIVRGENKSAAKKFIQKDIMSITKDDVESFDAVIDCFGAWTPETLPLHTTTSQHLCDILSGTNVRLLIIGGAGSLFIDKEHTVKVFETKDFPAEYLPTAKAQSNELEELRKGNDVKWTFISPAADFQAEGERTGKYILAGEEFTLNDKGESVISYADYAIAMIDEVVSGHHLNERISVLKA